ncbi:MAG: cytochrome c [Elusimicrobia bacterium]|nr:cytochrome c [Elusimicrobiota bacterium]
MSGSSAPSASRRPALAALALAAALAACAGSIPRAPSTALARGRELYVAKCSSCHALYAPREYPPQRWPGLVADMSRPAKVTEEQARSILSYLLAVSAEGQGVK